MWIKICANTSLADALTAQQLGASALGFVFARSPRQVEAPAVRAIVRALPGAVECVGVFAGQPAEEIAETMRVAELHTAQLHGGIDTPLAARLRQLLPATELIQTVAWQLGDAAAEGHVRAQLAEAAREGLSRRVLIDARAGTASGGLGVAFDWRSAAPVFRSERALSLIVAGGLRPENVGEAIETLEPWGVDVASGVEEAPGRKSHAKLVQFLDNARVAFATVAGRRTG